jgi:hypothetical protein
VVENWIEERHPDQVTLHDRDKDQQRCRRNQARNDDFFQPIENAKKHVNPLRSGASMAPACGSCDEDEWDLDWAAAPHAPHAPVIPTSKQSHPWK